MRLALSVAGALLCGSLHAQAPQPAVRWLVQTSPLAGYRHATAPELWPSLTLGDELDLVRETDNAHDASAVRVEWRGRKLGYLPRAENSALAWLLDRGETPRARISRLHTHRNGKRRLEFEVTIE